jgi:elongation of very long chain fatty acids protein 6
MAQHNFIPIVACILYGIGIMFGKFYYFGGSKPPWNWRMTLAVWNLGLSVFSFIGLLRTLPHFIHNWLYYGWRENLCFDPEAHFGSGSTGAWVQFFILSKFPELLDTWFIVIHKKPLIFLHWYHHVSVLLYCWHSYVFKAPAGLIFCTMNYAVHAFMYFYYFLMAIRMKPKWIAPVYITAAQIAQMIGGVIVTMAGCYLLWFDPIEKKRRLDSSEVPCYVTADNNTAALIMYGSYLLLFCQFFFQRYSSKRASEANGHHRNGDMNGSKKTD